MRLFFIRHGQTPANVAGALSTNPPGPGLTDLGRRQAEALADILAGEQIAAIYATTLQRTVLTATPLAERLGLPITVIEGMQEIEAGDLEDRTDLAALHAYGAPMIAWGEGDWDARVPGGPSAHEFFARFDAGIAEITRRHGEDDTVAIINHGAGARVWAAGRAENIDADFVSTRELENTGVIVLTGGPEGGWHVETWQEEPVGGLAVDAGAADPMGGELG